MISLENGGTRDLTGTRQVSIVRELEVEGSRCLEIVHEIPLESCHPLRRLFKESRKQLFSRIELVKGIGPVKSSRLRRSGVRHLGHLKYHGTCKQRRYALELITAFKERDVEFLKALPGLDDLELVSCLSPRNVGYFDIETTGFLGSSVFLTALGIVDEEKNIFKVRQYLARSMDEEPAVVFLSARSIRDLDCLVTFNGKSFDVPVLSDRVSYLWNEDLVDYLPFHVDLVYPGVKRGVITRRCSLGRIERDVLGVNRVEDVPSSAIPGFVNKFWSEMDFPSEVLPDVITNYLRSPGADPFPPGSRFDIDRGRMILTLLDIIQHNIVDVTSLYRYLVHLLSIDACLVDQPARRMGSEVMASVGKGGSARRSGNARKLLYCRGRQGQARIQNGKGLLTLPFSPETNAAGIGKNMGINSMGNGRKEEE